MAALQPLGDYIVATAEAAETKTKSGIYIPETAAIKPKTVIVIAVGKDIEHVKIGDRIVVKDSYGSPIATEVKIDDENYMLINKEDILAIVK